MRTYIILLLFAFLAVGCKRHFKAFETIDLSFNKFWNNLYCFKVRSDGLTLIYNCDRGSIKHYYAIKLEVNQLDSISQMTETIINSNIDSLIVDDECDRCEHIVLFVNRPDHKFKFIFLGSGYNKEGIRPIYKLAKYLVQIANDNTASTDTGFEFESYLQCLFPPQPIGQDSFESDYFRHQP